ncbi:MAG: formylglycine-generating enzyme family protein [Alphaproteobacteria bacterium]
MKRLGLAVFLLLLSATFAQAWQTGEVFRDCTECPEVVVVPAGEFVMGADDGPADQKPAHLVKLANPFAMTTNVITFDQWESCLADGGCSKNPDDHEWGRGTRPVINVSWDDARGYAGWLSRKTGARYRLPTEAEFEYAARAGTTTAFWWGDEVGVDHANCRHCTGPTISDRSSPAGSYPANPFGLYDMNGNVWEWIADCWYPNHKAAPDDGSAREAPNCAYRVSKGGAWYYEPRLSRPSARVRQHNTMWSYTVGFRLVRELP